MPSPPARAPLRRQVGRRRCSRAARLPPGRTSGAVPRRPSPCSPSELPAPPPMPSPAPPAARQPALLAAPLAAPPMPRRPSHPGSPPDHHRGSPGASPRGHVASPDAHPPAHRRPPASAAPPPTPRSPARLVGRQVSAAGRWRPVRPGAVTCRRTLGASAPPTPPHCAPAHPASQVARLPASRVARFPATPAAHHPATQAARQLGHGLPPRARARRPGWSGAMPAAGWPRRTVSRPALAAATSIRGAWPRRYRRTSRVTASHTGSAGAAMCCPHPHLPARNTVALSHNNQIHAARV